MAVALPGKRHVGRHKTTRHDQEIREPAPLRHRHQRLCDARRSRPDGEERAGLSGLRRQDRRRHHALRPDADHLRAGEQGRAGLLPVTFLRQLIRFYGDSMQTLVPSYLEFSLDRFASEQQKFRQQFTDALGAGADRRPDAAYVRKSRGSDAQEHGDVPAGAVDVLAVRRARHPCPRQSSRRSPTRRAPTRRAQSPRPPSPRPPRRRAPTSTN